VRYVVIGGFAAQIHGSPYATRDVDVTPERTRENFARLSTALRELGAQLRVSDLDYPVEISLDERTFDQGTTWTFITAAGPLDIALLPDGTTGYSDLTRHASRQAVSDTLTISVASLGDVIRSKEAAGREKDRAVLPILRRLLRISREQNGLER
jgi:hypothetical protein